MIDGPIAGDAELRPLEPAQAEELFALVDRERERLRVWLPWVDPTRSVDDTKEFIATQLVKAECGEELTVVLKVAGRVAGVIGVRLDSRDPTADIGYWIAAEYEGRGLMTTAVRAVIDRLFLDAGIHRIEIRCAAGNSRSRAIPQRLGFTHEAVLREAQRLQGRFVDIALYSLLSSERGGGPSANQSA